MKQELLSYFPWPWLPSLALLIFFTVFVGLIIRVSLKSQRVMFTEAERLPLQDGEKYE